jgi:hypothetical protein
MLSITWCYMIICCQLITWCYMITCYSFFINILNDKITLSGIMLSSFFLFCENFTTRRGAFMIKLVCMQGLLSAHALNSQAQKLLTPWPWTKIFVDQVVVTYCTYCGILARPELSGAVIANGTWTKNRKLCWSKSMTCHFLSYSMHTVELCLCVYTVKGSWGNVSFDSQNDK